VVGRNRLIVPLRRSSGRARRRNQAVAPYRPSLLTELGRPTVNFVSKQIRALANCKMADVRKLDQPMARRPVHIPWEMMHCENWFDTTNISEIAGDHIQPPT
jgi:hypothetical protein